MARISEIAISNNALKILSSRYFLHQNGRSETPEELFRRVAVAVASAEEKWGDPQQVKLWEEVFFEAMVQLEFLPNSPTLMNAGTPLNQLSACFVLPLEDSLPEIFSTLKNAALIQQSGGGTGFNFSRLRPQGDPLTVTGGTASGPVSFMKIFNAATEYIKHGGKRRGANMGILNIDHPDVESFICAKRESGVLENFNISVGITDAFMKAVEKNGSWPLINPKTHRQVKTVDAKYIWKLIVENAWASGDPGLVFLDAINRCNPLPGCDKIEATNPCGEVPLLPYEACNLGSINLARFVNGRSIDWGRLEKMIETAIRFLDNIIDINNYIIPETAVVVHRNRKVGLGIMGWADLLLLLEIPYESDEAIALADELMRFFQEKSRGASASLAEERGNFPNWEKSIYYPDQPMRNATQLSIAPTGTISIIADASSSIEPLFALAFTRKNVLEGATLPEMNRYFIDYLKNYDLYSPDVVEQVVKSGTVAEINILPPEVKNLFRTALEISPEWHLKHQLVFQKYIDNAVAKTVNLPENSTVDDVDLVYRKAWKGKAKGITIFRYQSRSHQVLEKGFVKERSTCKAC